MSNEEFITKLFLQYHNMMKDNTTDRLDLIEKEAIKVISDGKHKKNMISAIKLCTIIEKEYRCRQLGKGEVRA